MSYVIGDKLYLYIVRGTTLRIHEGVVSEPKTRGLCYGTRKPVVIFESGHLAELVPGKGAVGHIQSSGPRLWLDERDDALAKRLFLEYEMEKMAELEQKLEKKRELIKMLEEE